MDPSGFPANVTAVLQETQDTDDYRVATSGTNFLALLEVGLEDLNVLPPLVPFQQYVSGCPSPALISPATDIGLQAVLTTPSSLNPGTSKLTDVLSALPDTTRLTITGHSLGGTIAATLALLFHETLGKLAANLNCYAFASATAGNAAFRAIRTACAGQADARVKCALYRSARVKRQRPEADRFALPRHRHAGLHQEDRARCRRARSGIHPLRHIASARGRAE